MLAPERVELHSALLAFYKAHARDLPWRRTRDPFAIWVSEIMLQQTQVDTVVPRFNAFLDRFPSVRALAAAAEHEVCEAWAGLGYYRRARLLHRAAQVVVAEYGGALPTTRDGWLALPGVGRYTAGAISSIALGHQAPIVDGNVERVFARITAWDGPVKTPDGLRAVWAWAEDLVTAGPAPGLLNQALMELGATVCTPRQPRCGTCSVQRFCAAFKQGQPERYPPARAAAPKKELRVAFARVLGSDGALWLRRRPLEGLWAGLWEPPSAEGRAAKKVLGETWGLKVGRILGRVEHQLTHRHVVATVYDAVPLDKMWRPRTTLRVWQDPMEAPLSALARKAIRVAAVGVVKRQKT